MAKYKAVPLPPELAEDLAQRDPGLRSLGGVIHTAEQLAYALRRRRLRADKTTLLDRIACYHFVHCYNLSVSVWLLSTNGMEPTSMILVRAMLESLIDLAYLWKCTKINGKTSKERQAWLQHDAIHRHSMSTMWQALNQQRTAAGFAELPALFEETWASELARRATAYREEHGIKEWAYKVNSHTGKREGRSVLSRAQAVDDTGALSPDNLCLEEEYITTYKWASRLVHGNSSGLQDYMQETADKILVMFGPSDREIGAPAAAVRYLLGMLRIVNHVLCLQVDLDAQLAASGLAEIIRLVENRS